MYGEVPREPLGMTPDRRQPLPYWIMEGLFVIWEESLFSFWLMPMACGFVAFS